MDPLDRQAEMLANRLRKRARHVGKWARREGVTCYRIYDRDIPEIPLAIDRYEEFLHIAHYRRGEEQSRQWLEAMARAAANALDIAQDRIFVKDRQRQRGSSQYDRLDWRQDSVTVREGGHRFVVNLRDYLDTGLFLDHRLTRARVKSEASGARFLNLFCYTGTFTVYAAAGGARATVSIDLSPHYLAWAERNMQLNDLGGPQHRFVRADALELLRRGRGPAGDSEPFDLAVLDPPTFSNSKKMTGVLDLQRDHAELINRTLDLMRPGGVLYFASNARRFRFDDAAVTAAEIADVGARTIPPDFARKRPHHCWRIVK